MIDAMYLKKCHEGGFLYMTPDMWMTLAILFAAIVLFITEWVRLDIVAIGVVVALMLTNILTTGEALAGFSSTAVILIAALFIVGGAVFQTGLAGTLGQQILRIAGTNETRLIVVVMAAVALMSGFISNTGTVAVLMPAVISLAASIKISPSRLLMPVAFASSLGGAATLIGTPPNIIVNQALRDANLPTLEFFSFTPPAVVLIILGIIFMATVGVRLIPEREPKESKPKVETPEALLANYKLPDSIYKVRVRKASPFVGMAVGETHLGRDYDISILEISRPAPPQRVAAFGDQEIIVQSKKNIPLHPDPATQLQRDDILIVKGDGADVGRAAVQHTLAIQPRTAEDYEGLISNEVGVAEVVLPPRSSLIGKTLVDLKFGKKHRLTVLDIQRPEYEQTGPIKNMPLRSGDIMLVQGEWRDILALRDEPRDFVLIGETEVAHHILNRKKAPIVLLILAGLLVLLVTGVVTTTVAALIAAMAVILTGCMTMDEAYDAIDWKSIVLIAGMIPMSTALEKVGLVNIVADGLTNTLGAFGPYAVMAGLFLLTSVFTQVLSNTATTVILAPLALVTAQTLGIAPQAFLLTIAFSASMAFASPVASPVNTLVMGAGSYRFGDYVKVGIPLIVLTFIASMIVLPLFFPF